MLTDDIIITLGGADDAPLIAALSRDDIEYGLQWTWTAQRVRGAMRDGHCNVAVAKQHAYLAGFGIMQYGDEAACLSLFAVSERWRRQGVGSRILTWLEDVAVSAGIFEVVVQLRESNRGGETFYAHAGFEVIDRVPRYYAGREPAIVMSKRLDLNATPHN